MRSKKIILLSDNRLCLFGQTKGRELQKNGAPHFNKTNPIQAGGESKLALDLSFACKNEPNSAKLCLPQRVFVTPAKAGVLAFSSQISRLRGNDKTYGQGLWWVDAEFWRVLLQKRTQLESSVLL